jgi:NAD(P)-dependent dehydrogenase (short-subunit alcohol dehydrogenase family)
VIAPENSGVAGRVILVTGGGSGIGRGLATHLTRAGAQVVIAERDAARLQRTLELLADEGVCHGVPCDVGIETEVRAAVETAVQTFGRLEGIVNNAMSWPARTPVAELTEDDLDICLRTGVKGSLWAMQAAYPHMRSAHWGRIVNVGSAAGLIGFPGYGAYAMAKEAIRALTRTAAREWAADGITVNCFLPVWMRGALATAVTEDAVGSDRSTAVRTLAALHPPGSGYGDPEADIGPAVAFLLSDASRFVTGQSLTFDGGTYAFA